MGFYGLAAVAAGRAVRRRLTGCGHAGFRRGHLQGIAALQIGGPDDFTNYELRMEAAWGREYKRGRYFHSLLGQPRFVNAGINFSKPAFRDRMLKALYKKAQAVQKR